MDTATAVNRLLLGSLRVGDAVTLTVDGKSHAVTVQRELRRPDGGSFGSPDYAVVTVGYGPGRWNTEVNAAGLAAGRYTLAVAE